MTTSFPLGEVAAFIRGITFKPEDKIEIDAPGAVVCMRTKNVQVILDQDDLIAIPPSFVKRQEQYLIEGDILVSTANSWELVGKSCWVPEINYKATAGGFISILRANREKVFPRYLYHWMNTDETQRNLRYCGRQTTNISNMSFDLACELKLPLPPLPDQKRIAAILDKADAIRRKRQQAVKLTEELLRSVFLDMFGDPAMNPKGWETGVLGDVIFSAKDGPHVSPEYADDGIPFLSARHVKPGRIEWNDLKHITIDEARIHWKKCKPEKGDILYTKGGTTGVASVFDSDEEIAVWVHIALLKLKQDKVNPYWLENMLNSKYCYDQSQRYTHGITNQDLGLKRMVNIEMYIPPLSEQNRFHEVVKKIKNLASMNTCFLREAENIFNSLLYKAFKGEA